MATDTNPLPPAATRLAVLGSPISHSQSPALHHAAYLALGLDWTYEAHQVDADGLAAFIAGLDASWRGLSLTMPLKQAVLPLVSDLDRVAALTGAANTVLFRDGGAGPEAGRSLSGFNTDVAGLVRALAEVRVTSVTHATILGAGATASSAMVAAAELGAEGVEVVLRSPAKAAHLVELGRTVGLVVTVAGFDSLGADRPSELVFSTLPGGIDLGSAVPGGAEVPEPVRRRAVLFDVSYAPWPSALARSWANAGGEVLSGLAMLLHQALVQVRIFVSGDPFEPLPREDEVLEAMRAALTA
ncbi:shikimate dehydrogenase [Glaciibacter sp. 2TAF33]|uniref:shikimate dehydrogenase n=1 Tax=Glaciibacter sp. 2TAF33 TaxID=3233015 RepID=UPI003F8FA4E1